MDEGCYGDYSVGSDLPIKDNLTIDCKKREMLAYIAATNPETFQAIVDDDIKIFHGTNGNALPGIVSCGLKSGNELTEMGMEVLTGEEWSRYGGQQRDFTSYTDDISTAMNYARIGSKAENELNFGVLLGTTEDDFRSVATDYQSVDSDVPEVGTKKTLPLENIKFIGVPEDKVEYVRKIIDNDDIKILPIDYDNVFFSTEAFGAGRIDDRAARDYLNGTTKKNTTQFSRNDIRDAIK